MTPEQKKQFEANCELVKMNELELKEGMEALTKPDRVIYETVGDVKKSYTERMNELLKDFPNHN